MTGVGRHTVVWLVRHGQTQWNRERRYLSRTDQVLTPFGVMRARALAPYLRRFHISAAITSGLARTQETATHALVAQAQPLTIIPDPRWAEADHGRWEGLTYAEVSTHFAGEAAARWADPWHNAPLGGEPLVAVQARVRAAWRDLIQGQSGGKVLLVAHATPLQLILCDLLGVEPERYWQFRLDLGSVSAIDLYPTAAILRTINHLPQLQDEGRRTKDDG